MRHVMDSPVIKGINWGEVVLDDGEHFKDAMLFPGGACEWNWRESGTEHVPGIMPADVEMLINHDADVLVLSEGMAGSLNVASITRNILEEKGIPYYILKTPAAVKLYNEFALEHQHVGALIHSTC